MLTALVLICLNADISSETCYITVGPVFYPDYKECITAISNVKDDMRWWDETNGAWWEPTTFRCVPWLGQEV